jgi:hypothetical protein
MWAIWAAFIGVAAVSYLWGSIVPLVLFGLLLGYIRIMKSLHREADRRERARSAAAAQQRWPHGRELGQP